MNNPLVFGPYRTTGDLDSNVCGGNWATDAFTRTFVVTPESDGSFDVTELFKGTFVTIAHATEPNDSSCTTSETGGVSGTMYGEYAIKLSSAAHADFNPYATCLTTTDGGETDACSTSSFFDTFLGQTGSFGDNANVSYAWEFYYSTPHNGNWSDTDHGISGEITG